jgi:hypothetical protein
MPAIGSSTFDSLVPDMTAVADIQAAIKLYHYGNTGFTQTSGQGVWGHLTSLNTSIAAKANTASPTFTGTVTMPTGTVSAAPLRLVSGTNLTTATSGSIEFDGANLYFTPSTTRKTVAFLDSNITGTADFAKTTVYFGGSSGTMNYSAPNRKIYTGSTPPSTGLSVGDIWMW